MINAWLDFVRRVAIAPGITTGVRKIVFDQHFELTWEELTRSKLTYEDLSYTAAKGRQLERIYWPQDGMNAAIERLKLRKDKPHTSVAVQMSAGVKDPRSQGHCMQSTVFTQTRVGIEISVLYRSTEVIQKFLADLIFFRQKLPALFGQNKPVKIKFFFVNTYMSALFAPILMRYDPSPIKLLRETQEADPKFFRTFGLSAQRNFNPICVYSYRTRVKQWEYHQEHVGNTSPKMIPVVALLSSLRGTLEDEDDGDEV